MMDGLSLTIPVSWRTFAETDLPVARVVERRTYRSPLRQRQAEAARQRLVEAALDEMRRGNFHFAGKHLANRVTRQPDIINRHFGCLHLFRHVLAREHWRTIAGIAGLTRLPEAEQYRLVWLIVAGAPPPKWTGGRA